MPRKFVNCIYCLLIVVPALQAATVRLQLEGLSGELKKNVRARLSLINSDEVSADERFRNRAAKAIKEGLQALGYYQPDIQFESRPAPAGGGRPVLIARVNAGEPVKIAASHVIIRGDAGHDENYLQLLRDGKPAVGSILNHGKYEQFKTQIRGLNFRYGYFDGEFHKSQLGVSVERHEAFWDIDYDSGLRYRFGHVSFSGSPIQEAYLEKLVPFDYGEYYSSHQLAELNQRLSATGWFSSVVVAPEFAKARKSKILPLQAEVIPRAKNSIGIGAGYATDVGPRVKASWEKPWVNSLGHSLTTSGNISGPEQQLEFGYKVPLLKNPLEQYYLMQGGVKRTDRNDTESIASTIALSRHWENRSGWQKALNLRWRLDHYTQGDVTDTTMLLYPGVSVNRTRSHGGLMPDWGDSQFYSLDVSNTRWGSAIDFAIIYAQNVWIRTLAEKHRFVVRASLGWIETSAFQRVPPDLRFFAGGDNSIRGYRYKSLSPRNDDDKLIGASKLATGSLEYQYNVYGNWWGAVFVDSGEAVNEIKRSEIKNGAGLGLRWNSPVGPIRLDIARAIGDDRQHDIQFYIGLGSEL